MSQSSHGYVAMRKRWRDRPWVRLLMAGAVGTWLACTVTILMVHDRQGVNRDPIPSVFAALIAGCVMSVVLSPIWIVAGYLAMLIFNWFIHPILELLGKVHRILMQPFSLLSLWSKPSKRDILRSVEQLSKERVRRETIRAECEMLYARLRPEIGPRFNDAMLADFLQRHLHDGVPIEECEQRARQLQDMLREHLHKVAPPPQFRNLIELADWFQNQKRQLDSVTDERLRRTLLAQLSVRYAELTTQLLEDTRSCET